MSLLNCRYYSNRLPDVDNVVMVNVRQTSEMGVYVKLLEYDNIDGMILLSELSRRRIRSLQKLIKIGRNEVVIVLRVDKVKGYIDLSKRRVTPEDIIKCEERFQKGRMAHSILRHVAERCKIPVLQLYETIGWPLAEKYGSAADAFKISIAHPHVWDGVTFQTPKVKEELELYIARRLTPHPIKLRADIEVQCFGYSGVEAVKTALRAGETFGNEIVPIKIRLVAPPLYVVNSLQCFDRDEGFANLTRAIGAIRESIEKEDGGSIRVVMPPKVVSEIDEEALKELMERKERENMEVSGDEDVDCKRVDSDSDPDRI